MELKEFYQSFVGKEGSWRRMEYNWRDSALYGLACGAHMDEIEYFYEKDMKALPTFGMIPYYNIMEFGKTPYFNAVNHETPEWVEPDIMVLRAIKAARNRFGVKGAVLDFDHELIMYRPIDPIKGTFQINDVVTGFYDQGDKGIAVSSGCEVYDEAGKLVCVNKTNHAWNYGGNFGGEPFPASPVVFPDREPDIVIDDQMSQTQAALYRLTGDTSYIHIDSDCAREINQPGPIMHGNCSMGFACRMAIHALIPGEPERMTRMKNQFRSVAFPGAEIRLVGWVVGEGKLYFRLLDKSSGKAILDRGEFEWR